MVTTPKLENRNEQPYVGIRKQVTMQELGSVLPPLHPLVAAWLSEKGLEPGGAPFWRYRIVDMNGKLEVDVAFPLASAVAGDGEIIADVLPAGQYVVVLHTGHPMELEKVTGDLLAWAEQHGITWQMDGDVWGGRVEWYFSDPDTEPDMNKWQTELAFLTAAS